MLKEMNKEIGAKMNSYMANLDGGTKEVLGATYDYDANVNNNI